MAGDEVEPEGKYCSERKGSTCRQIHPMPQFVQVGILIIQLNPISVLVMIYSVNKNKDSNVVIEHKGRQCNNVIEATTYNDHFYQTRVRSLSTLFPDPDWMTDSCF